VARSHRSLANNLLEEDAFSEEDDAKKEQKKVQRQLQRYGHRVNTKKYKISNFIKIIGILFAILIIPL
jgi:hypothetical protein